MFSDFTWPDSLLVLLNQLIQGYAIFIVLLFTIRLVKGKLPWLVNLLVTANYVILVVAVLYMINLLWNLFAAYQSNYLQEEVAFYNRVMGRYWWAYLLLYVVQFLPLLFLFKKVRVGFTLPLILVLSPFPLIERYIIIITSLMDDYLPASWSYILLPLVSTMLSSFFIFSLLVFGVFFAQRIWRKTKGGKSVLEQTINGKKS